MSFLNKLAINRQPDKEKNEKSKIEIYLIPNKIYQEKLLEIIKNAVQEFKGKLLYISINKPAEKIIETMKKNDVDSGKIFFIDAVSKDIQADISDHGIAYISSPQNFAQFNADLMQILEKEKPECLVFDSLSTILLYQPDLVIVRFAHDLIAKIIVAHACGKFACLLEDVNSTLIKDVSMFADSVIEMGEQRQEAVKEPVTKTEEAIAKLENELQSIKEAYALKFLSEESYLASKQRIEAKLERLKNKK
jgi:hypothetical protein